MFFLSDVAEFRKYGAKDKKRRIKTINSNKLGMGFKKGASMPASNDPVATARAFRAREVKAGRLNKGIFG